jgi:hypothetical protein
MLRTSTYVYRPASKGLRQWARFASSQPRGLSAVLDKRADDVVITFAKRTAMGRKGKGQLAIYPVDEIVSALLEVCPFDSVNNT